MTSLPAADVICVQQANKSWGLASRFVCQSTWEFISWSASLIYCHHIITTRSMSPPFFWWCTYKSEGSLSKVGPTSSLLLLLSLDLLDSLVFLERWVRIDESHHIACVLLLPKKKLFPFGPTVLERWARFISPPSGQAVWLLVKLVMEKFESEKIGFWSWGRGADWIGSDAIMGLHFCLFRCNHLWMLTIQLFGVQQWHF